MILLIERFKYNHNIGYYNYYKGYKMNILQFLKKDENVRKIFGIRELKIIEKQLLGINLTQSEKNRLSRDIRKKFEFIEKVSRFETDFKLKKGDFVKKNIEETKEIILSDKWFKKINKIILFGSYVRNSLNYRSDIDIAIVFDKITVKEATLFRKRVLGKCPEKMDVQVYNVLPMKVRKEIDKEGRVIYDKKKFLKEL